MDDTAQSFGAAETDPIASAAEAFKNAVPELIGQQERPRDEHGRFAPTQQIEVPEAADEVAEGAESPEEVDSLDEAADEAQPEPVDLPPSWPEEMAEEWQTLPAAVQEKIIAREAEREAAVNAKFQEAANVRKANEATITEAQQSAQRFVQVADAAMALIEPQWPSESMLIAGSNDYNPDAYHYYRAQAEKAERQIATIQQHREEAVAQLTKEAEAQALEHIAEVEAKTRPALLKDVPDLADAQKQPAILNSIVQYAIEAGIPQDVFTDPEQAKYVTSAQLHLAWKAQQYDKMVRAKANVQPKAARPAAPVVKPGVATSPTQAKAIQHKNVRERLKQSGSIEDGAAFWKTVF
jgi:hypothetical protein